MPRSAVDAAKRKKSRHVTKQPPFPVPMATVTREPPSDQSWFYYTGCLQGSSIVVRHSGDMDFLHKMGFFGKGTLSRSEPSFVDRRQRMNVTNGGNTEFMPVMNKRTYLAHRRYKASRDGNVRELNDITFHEDQQHYLDEFTDDEEEEEYDDDDEEEEDDSGPRRGFEAGPDAQDLMKLTNLADLPVPRLVTLLNHVNMLSSESIASFIEVPYSLSELSTKFKVMRKMELNYFNQLYAINFPGRNFKEGEVIDLDEDDKPDDDAVMILSSDEEDGAAGEGKEDKSKSEDNKGEKNKDNNGWDDDDNDGDAEFWGTAKSSKDTKDNKDKVNQEKVKPLGTSDGSENKLGVDGQSEILSTTNVKESNSKLDITKKLENTESSECEKNNIVGNKSDAKEPEKPSDQISDKKSPEKHISSASNDKLSSALEKNIEDQIETSVDNKDNNKDDNKDNDKDNIKDNNEDNNKDNNDSECKHTSEGADRDNEPSSSGAPSASESKLTFCSDISPEKPSSSSKEDESKKKEDSNDSDDDIICIESESAEPKKLHKLLSTATDQESSGKAVDTRSVKFMSCIANEPTFVTARVGFHTWGQVVHFNYTGDPSHLPTAMSVMATDKALGQGVECPAVYERVFPQVKSLLPNPNSEGAVIKQRLKPLPCLNTAKMLLINDGPSTSGLKKTTIVKPTSTPSASSLGTSEPKPSSSSSSSNRLGQLTNGASISKDSSSTLLEKYLTTPSPSGGAVNNSSTSSEQKSNADASTSKVSDEDFKVYLLAFGVSLSDDGGETKADKVTDIFSKEKVTSLDNILKKVESASEADRDALFISFSGKLDDYLSHEKITSQKESIILRCVCSKQTVTGISGVIHSQIHGLLSPFQTSLLKRRLELRSESEKSQPSKETIGVGDDDVEMVDNVLGKVKCSENGADSDKSLVSVQENHGDDKNEDSSLKRKADKDSSSNSENNSKRVKTDDESFNLVSENKLCVVDKSSDLKEMTNSVKTNGETDNHCSDEIISENSESKKSVSVNSTELSADNSESSLKLQSKDNPEDTSTNSHKPEESGSGKLVAEKNDSLKPVTESLSSKELSSPDVMECDDDGEGPAKNKDVVTVDLETVDLDGEHDLDLVGSKQKTKQKSPAKGGSKDNQITIGSSSDESQDDDDDGDDDDETEEEEESFESDLLPNGRRMLPPKRIRYNPYSAQDDSGYDNLVVGNSSDDDSDSEFRQHKLRSPSKAKWRPCLKKDPCPVKEDLRLSLEEAFFLSYGLGCLRIFDADKALLDLKDTWVTFCTLKDQFVPHYVAYHYLRSKGWVPKSGLKFGADFILYKEGPPFYHGSYSVLVVPVKGDTLKACCRGDGMTFDPRSLSWVNMAGLSRITEHVAKELLICYVLYPADLSQDDLMSPACVGRFTVKEVVVSRWVSSKERAEANLEEFP